MYLLKLSALSFLRCQGYNKIETEVDRDIIGITVKILKIQTPEKLL